MVKEQRHWKEWGESFIVKHEAIDQPHSVKAKLTVSDFSIFSPNLKEEPNWGY